MRVLIIAPHQDDETLAAGGLIQKCVNANDTVIVLYVTNGDYKGRTAARIRYHESVNAITHLGLSSNNVFYLGYGDTGMRPSHSFLRKLLISDHDKPFTTHASKTTYHPAQKQTIHTMREGKETLMTHSSFLMDLSWFIELYNPELMLAPHPLDMHGDHAAICNFLLETNLLNQVQCCLTYIIHGGSDDLWPMRNTKLFNCPSILPKDIWDTRICIPLSYAEQQKKHAAICAYSSQIVSDTTGFLSAFCKQEEVFFLLQNSTTNQQSIYSHFEYKGNS